MSTNDQPEEIRQLSEEEYQRLRYQIMDCRRKRITRKEEAQARGQLRVEMQLTEEGREIGWKVWELRKEGKLLHQIAKILKLDEEMLALCLQEYETRTMMATARAVEHYRNLDNERLEDLMAAWLPVATAGPTRVERYRHGELVSELDYERPTKASFIILQIIDRRIKLMLASQPDKAIQNETNVVVWLQSVMPQVSQVVRAMESAPEPGSRQTLVLESSAEQMGENDAPP